jgi:hypothetical protein
MQGDIVVFRLPPRLKKVEVSRFCQGFYGQNTSSHGGKYRYHRRGILDDIPYRKLIRGVIILKSEDLDTVLTFLDRYDAEVYVRRIRLVAEDHRVLGLSQK